MHSGGTHEGNMTEEELRRLISVDVLIVIGLIALAAVAGIAKGDWKVSETVAAGLLGYIGRAAQR